MVGGGWEKALSQGIVGFLRFVGRHQEQTGLKKGSIGLMGYPKP